MVFKGVNPPKGKDEMGMSHKSADVRTHPLLHDPALMTPTQHIRTHDGDVPYDTNHEGYPAHARGYHASDLADYPDMQPSRPVLSRHPYMVGMFGSALAVIAWAASRGLLRK